MGTRLSIITTRTGDNGETGLADGSRVAKHSVRIHAIGDVDELNSVIGVWRTEVTSNTIDELLSTLQHDLFDLGAELCLPNHPAIQASHIKKLDDAIAYHNAQLPSLKEFILPGGCKAASYAHLARTVTRRTERSLVELMHTESLRAEVIHYINRLSDLCFVLARILNQEAQHGDVLWQPTPHKA